MRLFPCAHIAAITIAIPARISGDTRWSAWSILGPHTTARWGSQRVIFAPIEISLSTKNILLSNIFSKIKTVPSTWVATTVIIEVKSAGKPGHGISSIFGIAFPKSLFTFKSWVFGTVIASPSILHEIPSFEKLYFKGRNSSGRIPLIVIFPWVAAAIPIYDPISI